jgi:hypothetical protein
MSPAHCVILYYRCHYLPACLSFGNEGAGESQKLEYMAFLGPCEPKGNYQKKEKKAGRLTTLN